MGTTTKYPECPKQSWGGKKNKVRAITPEFQTIEQSYSDANIMEAKNVQEGRTVFYTNGAGKTGETCRKIKLDPYLIPLTQVNTKWIKDWNIRPTIMKLLENTEERSSVIPVLEVTLSM